MRRVNRKGDTPIASSNDEDAQNDDDIDVTKKYARPVGQPICTTTRRQLMETKFMFASLLCVFYFVWVTQYWLPDLPSRHEDAHRSRKQRIPPWRRNTILLTESSDDGDRDESPPRRRKGHDVIPDETVSLVFLPGSIAAAALASNNTNNFLTPQPLEEELKREAHKPDYGELDVKFLLYDDDGTVRRHIFRSPRNEWSYEMLQHYDPVTMESLEDLQDDVDFYYAFDDDYKRNPLIAYTDDKIQDEKHCRRTSWHRDVLINCNSLHEFDVQHRFRSGEASFLGNGAYRYAYLAELADDETVVFKSYNYDYNFETKDYEYMRIDALVADQLSWSPLTVGIHGFCGTSMINEAVMGSRMESIAIPYDYDGDEEYNHLLEVMEGLEELDVLVVLNKMTARDKLWYALLMSDSILLLHSFPGGVIVHDGKFLVRPEVCGLVDNYSHFDLSPDLTLEQFLIAEDGTMKLNDFNRAEFMLWNEQDEEYCRYRNNPGAGYVRFFVFLFLVAPAFVSLTCLFKYQCRSGVRQKNTRMIRSMRR